MATAQEDKVQGSYELGPRSLALLRRLVAALEKIVGEVPDPGKVTESDAQQVD